MSAASDHWRWPLYDKKIIDIIITGGKVTKDDLDLIREYLGIMDEIFAPAPPADAAEED
jgi:hypothetical protein